MKSSQRNIITGIILTLIFLCYSSDAQDIENIKSQKPFTVSGTLGASLTFYNAEHRQPSHNNFSWMLNGAPVVSVYGVTLPFSFAVSEQQRTFRQPFNKIGVSPYYKWIKTHLGWQTTNFSNYTLADYTWLGAGIELTPGNFRFSFMNGRLNKAIEEDTLNTKNIFQTPLYRRTVYCVKAGYGTEKNFVDIILMKAKDDSASIHSPVMTNIAPGENAVIGLNTRQKITDKISVTIEAAQSLYTTDVRSIVNDSAIVPKEVTGIPSFLLHSNPSTVKGDVVDGTVTYAEKKYSVGLQYKRISPDFYSMGTYYLLNDVREITVKPSATFWKNKIQAQLSFGLQQNNLNKDKPVTTKRSIGSLNVTAQPFPVYFINFAFSNYNIGQDKEQISPDSIYRIAQTTGNIMLTQVLSIVKKNYVHALSLIINNQTLSDRNKTTDAGYKVLVLNGNYQISAIKIKLTAGAGYLMNRFSNFMTESVSSGPVMNLNKTYYKNKLRSGLSLSLLSTSLSGKSISNISVVSFNTFFKQDKHHGVSLRIDYQNVHSKQEGILSSNEIKTILSYAYNF